MIREPAAIGVASAGLWRLRDDLASLLGRPIRRLRPWSRRVEAIAGWGHKATADAARARAARLGVPYLAIEDGFLRSVRPGPDELRLSYVVDRTGVYYDASAPSDLEAYVRAAALRADPAVRARGAAARALLARTRLSKYNDAPDLDAAALGLVDDAPRVLVVDQTAGDASIAGAGADRRTFAAMLAAARAENPDAELLVKIHPETVAGAKGGHFDASDLGPRARALAVKVNPWSLFDRVARVYVVSSQVGFEALVAGLPVVCFGSPFYSGWGLTDDRMTREAPAFARRACASVHLDDLVAAVYFDYCRYLDADTRKPTIFEVAAAQLAALRDASGDRR